MGSGRGAGDGWRGMRATRSAMRRWPWGTSRKASGSRKVAEAGMRRAARAGRKRARMSAKDAQQGLEQLVVRHGGASCVLCLYSV